MLNAEDPDKLLRELRKAGYLPVSDDDKPKSALNLEVQARPALPLLRIREQERAKTKNALPKPTATWTGSASRRKTARPTSAGKSQRGRTAERQRTRNQTLIKTLLVQACKMQNVVEIEYLEQGNPQPTRREIEPERIMGSFVTAYDRLTGETLQALISREFSGRV